MNFLVYPPEVNSARLYSGAGSGSMLAAAAGWDGLAAELGSASASFGSTTLGLAGSSWQGPASVAMTEAAAPYVELLNTAAGQAADTAAQARAAASSYEAARAAAVHPALVTANRTQLVSLVNANLFGQNTPVIAAVEAHYEQMWAQDVAVMAGYHAQASAVVEQLTAWPTALHSLSAGLGGGAAAPLAAAPLAAANSAVSLAAGSVLTSIGDAIEAFYYLAQPWVQWGVEVLSWAVGWVPWIGWLIAPQILFFYYLWQPIFQALLFNTINVLDGTVSLSQGVINIITATQAAINQFAYNEITWVLSILPPLPPIARLP